MSTHLASPDDHSRHCRGMNLAVSVVEITLSLSVKWLSRSAVLLLGNHGHGLLKTVFVDDCGIMGMACWNLSLPIV